MEESPLVMPPAGLFNIILLLSIVIWSFLSTFFAQYILLELYLISWLLPASGLILLLGPVVFTILWAEKSRIELLDVEWDFRRKEIAFSDYKTMSWEYAKAYSGIIQTTDTLWLILTIVSGLSALFLPFIMANSIPIIIQFSPFVFGLLIALYGICLSVFLRAFIPASISDEFPFTPARNLRNAIDLFISTPSISWTGISIDIGKFGEYYVLEDLQVVARIDSIESAAYLIAEYGNSGEINRIVPVLLFDDAPELEPVESNISPKSVQNLVVRIIKSYVAIRGSNELLDEVLEELSLDLSENE